MLLAQQMRKVGAGSVTAILQWPIKSSFRAYVERLSDGAVAARDGALVLDDTTHFTIADVAQTQLLYSATFRAEGEVRFGGHGGMLVVPFREPTVERDEDGRHVLSIDYPWASTTPEPKLGIAVVQWSAWCQRDDGSLILESTSVALTAEGAELFNDMYEQGSELDQLTVFVD